VRRERLCFTVHCFRLQVRAIHYLLFRVPDLLFSVAVTDWLYSSRLLFSRIERARHLLIFNQACTVCCLLITFCNH
jgi:hypothetical protein